MRPHSRIEHQARHHQHIALVELAEDATQLDAVGPRAAGCFAKDLLGSGSGVEALAASDIVQGSRINFEQQIAPYTEFVINMVINADSPKPPRRFLD